MAEKNEMQVLAFDMVCPKCGSHQFSISPPDQIGRPPEWPSNALGAADCCGCDGNFLVKLPPELENALVGIAEGKLWTMFARPDGVHTVRQFVKYLLFGQLW